MEKRLSSGSRADEKKKKKDHTRQMRARSSDYVGCRVKSKVSRWFFFFFFWMWMDSIVEGNLEERVEVCG